MPNLLRQNKIQTCDSGPVLSIESSVNFVEQIEWSGVTFLQLEGMTNVLLAFEIINLNGEDEGECDESLLSARQLLHFASARSVVRVE